MDYFKAVIIRVEVLSKTTGQPLFQPLRVNERQLVVTWICSYLYVVNLDRFCVLKHCSCLFNGNPISSGVLASSRSGTDASSFTRPSRHNSLRLLMYVGGEATYIRIGNTLHVIND
jgi:hypothetical protein